MRTPLAAWAGVLAGLLLTASMAYPADVSSEWNGGTGDWIDPLNWMHTPGDVGADYPHNDLLTYDVRFDGGEATLPEASEFTLNSLWMTGGTLTGDSTITLDEGFRTSATAIRLEVTRINMMRTSRWDAAAVTVGEWV